MNGNLIFAIGSFLFSIATGVLLTLYPGLRLFWWFIFSLCVSGVICSILKYCIQKFSKYWDIANLGKYFILSCGLVGFLLVTIIMLYFDPQVYRKNNQDLQPPIQDISMFLQFSKKRDIPKEISQTNILSWYVLYTPSININELDKNNKTMGGIAVLPDYYIFILFKGVVNYRQMIATCQGAEDLKCSTQFSNGNYAIISVTGDVTNATLDIHTI